MNFQILQSRLAHIEELVPISRNTEIDGVICHVMGMVRRNDDTIQMLILEYDESYWERREEAKIVELTDAPLRPITNRIEQQGHRDLRPDLHFHGIEQVWIGDLELTSNGSCGSICGTGQWDKVALFTRFLLSGWNPAGIDTKDIDSMYLTSLKFEGEYDAIPALDPEASIRFSMRSGSTRHLVELPMTLTVGGEYPDKLYFTDQKSGARHWIQINRVTLCDMWAEMSKTLDEKFEESFSEICPRGMCYAVVEYESEEDISLQFYSKRWLDAEPIHSSSGSMGFIMSPDEPKGKLGLKLKAVVIPEPISPDAISIEAELFQYNRMNQSDDIIITK